MALTTEQRLEEAREAYHALVTGQGVAEIRDQNGETIRYARADISKLSQYIATLEQLVAGNTKPSAPMRVFS